jgi:hypothetical protein
VARIPFSDGGTVKGELIVPDCWGEYWKTVYTRREWSQAWDDLIAATCGCLIFVRVDSDQIVPALDPVSCGDIHFSQNTPDDGGEQPVPTEVMVTDWLQMLRHAFTERVSGRYCPRVGIVVTAWDLVPCEVHEQSPEEYVAREFPMLKQFMDANLDRYEFASFGVSILGGDPKIDRDFYQICIDCHPLKAGYVVHNLSGTTNTSPDLAIPVAWAARLFDR